MRGQRATGKIQRNNYHHDSCEPFLTDKTSSVSLIFTQVTHRNVKNRWVRSSLKFSFVVTFFWIIKNVYARAISKKFSKYSAFVWVFIVKSDWSLYNMLRFLVLHIRSFLHCFQTVFQEPYSSPFHKYSRPRSSPRLLTNWVIDRSISKAFSRSWWALQLSMFCIYCITTLQSNWKGKCKICTPSIAAHGTNIWTKLWCYCLLTFCAFSFQS